MNTKVITVIDLSSSKHLAIPPRSPFYYLKPVGVGTPLAESLISYILNLAKAHCIVPRTLVTENILPLFNRQYMANSEYHSLSTFWKRNSPALNGVGNFANDWVWILESLTKRTDLRFLTMLTWSDVLPPKGLIRRHRAWCPLCYEEWRQMKQTVYEPLLWSLEVVTICKKHCRWLNFHCPACQQKLPFLSSQTRPGYCSECGVWLGMEKKLAGADSLSEEELEWQTWVVSEVGELLAAAPKLSEAPSRDQLSENIAVCVDQIGGGDATAFAQELQHLNVKVSKWSVWDWQKGQQLPQLSTLLQLCYCFNIRPLQLLTKENLVLPSAQASLPKMSVGFANELKPPAKPFNVELLRCGLEKIAANEQDLPLSMTKVSDRLDHDQSHLAKLFPEYCQPISKRHQVYVHEKSLGRKQSVRYEVRGAMLKIHAEGRYPSMRQVRKLLSNPNLMGLPEAQETWRETLAELGWDKR